MRKKINPIAVIVIILVVCSSVGCLIYGYYKNGKKENVQENRNFLIHKDPKEILDLGGGYSGNDEVIIYGEKKVENADAKTFYSIGKGYGKDKNSIFAGGLKIKDADRETFIALEYSYAKDKRVVYYLGRDLKESDPKSFEIIDGDYSKDDNFVYSYGRIVRGADPKSFSKDRYYDLYKDKNNYYSDGDIFSKNDFLFFKKGIKVSGVKNIGYEYVSYKGKIYFYDASCQAVPGYAEVDGADAGTFKVLNSEYANDKSNCYRRNYVIRFADPKTFKVLSENYAKDGIAVYYDGVVVPGLDPENFEVVNYNMWKNKSGNYYPKDILDNRCLFDHLKGLMGDFGRNENNVYVGNEKIEGADPKTFSILGFGYSKDAQNVYYWKEKVPDADPKSMIILDRGLQITGADFIRPTVARDKNNVFQGTRKIEGADLESFKVIDDESAKDKSASYLYVFDEDIFVKQ